MDQRVGLARFYPRCLLDFDDPPSTASRRRMVTYAGARTFHLLRKKRDGHHPRKTDSGSIRFARLDGLCRACASLLSRS